MSGLPNREEGWGLYFTEFSVSPVYTAETGCARGRSVLQLGRVHVDSQGWMYVNRSEGPPLDLSLRPPPGWAEGSAAGDR